MRRATTLPEKYRPLRVTSAQTERRCDVSGTLKQINRRQYLKLCQQYNACNPYTDTARFAALSVALHFAKGGDGITRRMRTMAHVRSCGKGDYSAAPADE